MNSLSLRLPSRRTGYVAAVFTLLFATITSAFASAAQVTQRSIALSSSAADASGVTYQVNFTAATNGTQEFVVDFCKDSPLVNTACANDRSDDAHLAGFSASSAASGSATVTPGATTIKVVLAAPVNAGQTVSVDLTGIHNPTAVGSFYARIVTYASGGMTNYSSPTSLGTHLDEGGVALSTTSKIGVSADVLESLTFCVSGATIADNCGGTLTAPTLKLGEDVGGVTALTTNISSGNIFTQISTNAVNGAIVSLKSSTLGCGGLSRAGAASFAAGCGIAPSLATDVTAGSSKFGVKTATATGGTGANGEFRPYDSGTGAFYNATNYKMNWVSGDASGVTSTYGDPFLDTHSLPVNNMNMQLTFAAAAANNTPAGSYSADLSLIATGKF